MRPNMVQPFLAPFRPPAMVADNDSEVVCDRAIPGLSLWMGQGRPHTAIQPAAGRNNSLSDNMQHLDSSMNVSALYGDQFASLSNSHHLERQLNLLHGNKLTTPSSAGELTSNSLVTSSAKEVDCSNSLLESSFPSLFSNQDRRHSISSADMSATALLQKAAQTGVSSSVPPFFQSFDMKLQNFQAHVSTKFDGLFSLAHPSLSFDLRDSLESSINDFAVSNPFVMCSARDHISQKDDLGGEITRDFLGVGAQTLCSSSLNGWI